MDLRRDALVVVLSSLVAVPVTAQDWPQWRGPARDGSAVGFASPARWPDAPTRRWTMSVGLGHASPVVVGERGYVFSRQGDREILSAFDIASGRTLWSDGYEAPYDMDPAARGHGPGPKSTPVVDGNSLCTFGISGILTCFDLEQESVRWRQAFSDEFPATSPTYGVATSPLVDDGLVIVYVGGDDGGALRAFDLETGDVRWSWAGDGAGYASPIIVTLDGVRQIVTQSHEFIVGLEAASGRLLWRLPFTTDYFQNIVTPVVYRDTLIFSGLSKETFAVRVARRGTEWVTETLWANGDVPMYMSSPVLKGDRLFGLTHLNKGQFFCVDARTGDTCWTSEGRQGDNAALVVVGDTLLLLTTGGELLVSGVTGDRFQLIRRYAVADSPTWAHPVPVSDGVLVKDESSLALWTFE